MHPIAFRVLYAYLFLIGVICAIAVFASFIENARRIQEACQYGYGFSIVVGVCVALLIGRWLMKLPRWDQVTWRFMVEIWLESLGLIVLGGVGTTAGGLGVCEGHSGYELNGLVGCVAVMCFLVGIPGFLWINFVLVMYLIGADWFIALVTCRACQPASSGPAFTSESRPHEVDFVAVGNGRVGMCISPGRKKGRWDRSLDVDLETIRNEHHTDVIVTLLTQQDLVDIQVQNLLDGVKRRGITSIHFPIRDKFVPEDLEAFCSLILGIVELLHAGKTVVVHCNGGKGRTGLVVAAILVAYQNSTVMEAIQICRAARPGVLYNPLQILYAFQFASFWEEHRRTGTLPLPLQIKAEP